MFEYEPVPGECLLECNALGDDQIRLLPLEQRVFLFLKDQDQVPCGQSGLLVALCMEALLVVVGRSLINGDLDHLLVVESPRPLAACAPELGVDALALAPAVVTGPRGLRVHAGAQLHQALHHAPALALAADLHLAAAHAPALRAVPGPGDRELLGGPVVDLLQTDLQGVREVRTLPRLFLARAPASAAQKVENTHTARVLTGHALVDTFLAVRIVDLALVGV